MLKEVVLTSCSNMQLSYMIWLIQRISLSAGHLYLAVHNTIVVSELCHPRCEFKQYGKFSQKHNYTYMAKRWCLLAMDKLQVSAYSGHLQV